MRYSDICGPSVLYNGLVIHRYTKIQIMLFVFLLSRNQSHDHMIRYFKKHAAIISFILPFYFLSVMLEKITKPILNCNA